MNPADPLAWGDTLAAQADGYRSLAAAGPGFGQMLLSLLAVLALIALLAWALKRLQPAVSPAAEEPLTILYYNRFNARQVFALWEQNGRRYAAILRGARVEMMVPWPAETAAGKTDASRPGKPATFQDIWNRLLANGRRRQP